MPKKTHWYIWMVLIFVLITCAIYFGHYLIFNDLEHLLDYFIIHLGFLPIYVLFISLVLDKILSYRQEMLQIKKQHTVISAFFSEAGNEMLKALSDCATDKESLIRNLLITDNWTKPDFAGAKKQIINAHHSFDSENNETMQNLRSLFLAKRQFFLALLQNPDLDHEEFSRMLLTLFHLCEEFIYRDGLQTFSKLDFNHLSVDLQRAFEHLVLEWLSHMEYLKYNFPYLFSLALRTNIFDPNCSAYIRE